MEAADTLIDIGPAAGSNGGQVVFSGSGAEIKEKDTLTAKYLKGEKRVYRERWSLPKTKFQQLIQRFNNRFHRFHW